MSGAAVVLVAVVGATVFIAVDDDAKDSQRPISTTTPSVTSAPSTTAAPPTTHATVPGSPIVTLLPPFFPFADVSYTQTFSWGTGNDQVAFHTPQGEGASGGPLAFTVDAQGHIQMLDHSSARIVRFDGSASAVPHAASAVPIALAGPAVTAAVFDAKGRVIVATVGDVAVFAPDGKRIGNFPGMSLNAITALEVDGKFVYSVAENRTRTLLLRDDGNGYFDTRDAEPEPPEIAVDLNRETYVLTMTVENGREYRIRASMTVAAVRAVRVLPDGTLTFVLATNPGEDAGPDRIDTFIVGRIAADGQAQYESVTASMGYLLNGPEFVINDDGIGVMGSTTTGGVTVSYYPFT